MVICKSFFFSSIEYRSYKGLTLIILVKKIIRPFIIEYRSYKGLTL